jgi:hypothetical protein
VQRIRREEPVRFGDMLNPSGFRGVIHCALVFGESRFAFAVGHPHPDNNHGGGPGPVCDWRKPYNDHAYLDLIDLGGDEDEPTDEEDVAEDESEDEASLDVSWELRDIQHVALIDEDAARLIELPHTGRIDQLRLCGEQTIGAVVRYGGSLSYVALVDWRTGNVTVLTLKGQPAGLMKVRGALLGKELFVAGTRGTRTETGLASIEGDSLAWMRTLAPIPEPIEVFDACRGEDGKLVAYAGGSRLWRWAHEAWEDVHSLTSASVSFVACRANGEVIAGTTRGEVIVGVGTGCRTLARVGPIHSGVRFGDAIYVADDERVYRIDDSGFERSFAPPIASVGAWPTPGVLVATPQRLWLAGSHTLASTPDGRSWSLHPIAEAA